MKFILPAVFAFCLLSLPMQAQSLYDELNRALLIAEKTDRAIERGKTNHEQILYEAARSLMGGFLIYTKSSCSNSRASCLVKLRRSYFSTTSFGGTASAPDFHHSKSNKMFSAISSGFFG